MLRTGAYFPQFCSTADNPSDLYGRNSFDRDILRTNNGRPDVFANRSTSGATFGVGLVALDDVFRVHAQATQMAMKTSPRMEGLMKCSVSSPPSIELADPMLGLRRSGDSYVQEWAVYPFFTPDSDRSGGCTDYYCFVNAQRHDMGSTRIKMKRGGFLGPGDSRISDLTEYEGTGYDKCFDTSLPNPNLEPKPRATAKTCWESWDARTFLEFIRKQGGPGGFVHVSNEVHVLGDRVWPAGRYGPKPVPGCGQVTLDGNAFANYSLQPPTFKEYVAKLVNQTRAANALLPSGSEPHKVIVYTDNFASTGVDDSLIFADSLIKLRNGEQAAYKNCTKPGDNASHVGLLGFYADGRNSFSAMLKQYYLLALELGADGIFHGPCNLENVCRRLSFDSL